MPRGRGVALDIANGLSYLHQRGVLHLDIKVCHTLILASSVKLMPAD